MPSLPGDAPDVDREILSGGDFTAGVGPVHFGSAEIPLQKNEDLLVDGTNGATTHVFTVNPRGGPAFTRKIHGSGSYVFSGRSTRSVKIDSADTPWQWEKRPRGDFRNYYPPGNLDVQPQGQTPVQISSGDSTPGTLLVPLANGGVAPASGVVWATVAATATDPITISDGTNTLNVIASATGAWQLVQFHVIATVTYTLAGIGLKILGTSMFIGVG